MNRKLHLRFYKFSTVIVLRKFHLFLRILLKFIQRELSFTSSKTPNVNSRRCIKSCTALKNVLLLINTPPPIPCSNESVAMFTCGSFICEMEGRGSSSFILTCLVLQCRYDNDEPTSISLPSWSTASEQVSTKDCRRYLLIHVGGNTNKQNSELGKD